MSKGMKLDGFKALTFDVYGTLIDWESGIFNGLQPLLAKVDTELSRDTVLEAHAFHESATQAQTPAKRYPELLAVVYKRLAEEWGVAVSWGECRAYGASVAAWPAFADSAESLRYLKQHFKLVILSNVDNESFRASQQKLGVAFDAVYTAEDAGSYKPTDRNFAYMLENLARLGVRKDEILHTAESMFHDHVPARRNGMHNCWIYRRFDKGGFGATMNPGDLPPYDFRFDSMADLVRAHRDEVGG